MSDKENKGHKITIDVEKLGAAVSVPGAMRATSKAALEMPSKSDIAKAIARSGNVAAEWQESIFTATARLNEHLPGGQTVNDILVEACDQAEPGVSNAPMCKAHKAVVKGRNAPNCK